MRRNPSFRSSSAIVLPSLVALAALIALPVTVHAIRSAAPPPTVVASVDYPRVVQQLSQFAEAQQRVQKLVDGIRGDEATRKEELEKLKAATEVEGLSADALAIAREDYALKALEYQAWFQFAMEQVDIERSILMRDLDRAIVREVKALCQISGYDLVITNDSGIEIVVDNESQTRREAQVQSQMRSRRVLYAASTTDITEELILRMNNQFSAGTP